MKVKLLPSHFQNTKWLQTLTTILVNRSLAIDGGSLGLAVPLAEQTKIRNVVVTHEHIDHVATLPLFVSEVFPFLDEPFRIYGSKTVIASLKKHIFNDLIWPRFDRIDLLQGSGKGLEYVEIEEEKSFEINGLTITPITTSHIIPTHALVLQAKESSFCFTSDTYRTDRMWDFCNQAKNLKSIFIDVSYPNEMEGLAQVARHLTPHSLDEELKKLKVDGVKIQIVHMKPQYRDTIMEQLENLGRDNISVVEMGKEYSF